MAGNRLSYLSQDPGDSDGDGDNDGDNDGSRLTKKREQPVLQLKQPPSGPPSERNGICGTLLSLPDNVGCYSGSRSLATLGLALAVILPLILVCALPLALALTFPNDV